MKTYKCLVCFESFNNPEKYTEIDNELHTSQTFLVCPFCGSDSICKNKYICKNCEEPIAAGETAYQIGDDYFCEDCCIEIEVQD